VVAIVEDPYCDCYVMLIEYCIYQINSVMGVRCFT
jgi:hypothetical protein